MSLDLFRSSFVRHNNVGPHTACESNFDVMVNSLSLPKDLNNGLAKVVPGVLTDPNNPAIIYAEGHWSWTYYNHLSSDPESYYCTSYNINSNQCVPQPNILGTDTPDDGKFDPGYFQPQFQCAEFVTRALAAAGYVPGLDPINSTSDDVASYKGLNLRLVDELLPYLLKIGAVDVGDNPAMAVPGDVVFYDEHVAVLIETGTTSGGSDTIVDAHNKDGHRVEYTLGGIAGRHILHLPPLPNFTPNGVILYDHPAYDFRGNTLNFANPGSYTLTTFNDMASSIAIRPGWTVIAYQGSNGSGASALLYKSVPDLRFVYFSNSTTPLDKHISSLLVTNGPPICSASHSLSTIHTVKFNNSTCQPPPCNDAATFITDISYPDGSALAAGQSFNKTWRIQNSGNCTQQVQMHLRAITAHQPPNLLRQMV